MLGTLDVAADGLANYLQDRMSAHQKWAWMLRATARR